MDVSLLRRALRLVHCLQKERGASCAVCASTDTGFQEAMQSARQDTDVAASRLYRDMPPALTKIRLQLDERSTTQVHRMLVIFNTLISHVVHEYILQYLQKSLHTRKKRGYHRQRSDSADGVLFQTTNDHRYQSDNLVPDYVLPHAPIDSPRMPPDLLKPMSDPALFSFTRHDSPPRHSYDLPIHIRSSSPPSRRKKQVSSSFLDIQQDRTESLLNLLGCLVRLKESTGMQRAVITSIVPQESQTHHLVTTLILEVENQRKLQAELQQLPLFDYSLQKLVQDSIKMGDQMESLQTKILKDFNVGGFQNEMASNELWDMITVYIDKLHSLELLLVEELEYSVAEEQAQLESSPSNKDDEVLQRIFGSETNVADLSADAIKKKLVEFMGQAPVEDEAPPPPLLDESSGSLLHFQTAGSASKEWEINLEELQFKKRIGRGSAGTTYLAKWSGQTVAVKVAAITEMGVEGWKTEVQSLQRLHHTNVIRLLGSVYNENPLTYCLVLEHCNAGDLSSALQVPTPRNFVFSVATDIANGMAYLHRRGVLHRDIKPDNVLLDGNVKSGSFTAKVSDFGVATTFEGNDNRTAETGTYRWMAPEIIRHEQYSFEADVYSSAILFWQLLTRENPLADVSPLEAAGKVALELARPPFPEGTPVAIQELISTCWSEGPSKRLPFEQISTALVEIQESLTSEEKTWLEAPMGHSVYRQPVQAPPELQVRVPNPPKPPLDSKRKPEKRTSGLRSIFAKQHKNQGH